MPEPTPENIDADLRAANARGRFDPDKAPALTGRVDDQPQGPAGEDPPAAAYADLPEDELRALITDRATRREVLADPAVRRRLAMEDPDIRATIEAAEARAQAAEERAEAKLAAIAANEPRPRPLPGGGAAPTPPAPPSPESILRAAIGAAKGEPVDHRMRPYVRPGHDVTVTGFSVQ